MRPHGPFGIVQHIRQALIIRLPTIVIQACQIARSRQERMARSPAFVDIAALMALFPGAEVSSSQFAAKVGSQSLTITAESDKLVLFGDGIEADASPLTWGQTASIHLATRTLRLLH